MTAISPLEASAVVASALGVWLTTRRLLVSWPVVILSCLLYAEVFRDAKLYSDMLLQGVYAAFALYGWWNWRKGVQEEGEVRVQHLPVSGLLLGLLSGVVGSCLLGGLMARYTNAPLPYWDSSLTSFSLVAQIWSARKYIENWALWLLVDVVYTAIFIYKNLYLTAGLYAFFVFLAAWGWRSWSQSLGQLQPE